MMSKKGCFFTALIIFLVLAVGFIYGSLRPISAFETQTAFVEGLVYNDMDKLRLITSPEQLHLLENWEEVHAPIPKDCKFPEDPDVGTSGVGHFDKETGQDIMNIIIGRECPNDFYNISMDDVSVEKINGNWMVVSWGKYGELSIERAQWCYDFDTMRAKGES
ncbi:MAG: hypothetical protein Kow0080_09580 [Candidatus Promineifilaceae bacterium]